MDLGSLEMNINICGNYNSSLLYQTYLLAFKNILSELYLAGQQNECIGTCIACGVTQNTVLNTCKCGIETFCYTCMKTRYSEKIVNSCISSMQRLDGSKLNSTTKVFESHDCTKINVLEILNVVKNVVCCNICKNTAKFKQLCNDVHDYKTIYNKYNPASYSIIHMELLENKSVVDIIPTLLSVSTIRKSTDKSILVDYSFAIEISEQKDVFITLKNELVVSIAGNNLKAETICLPISLMLNNVFNTIYFKCMDYIYNNSSALDIKLIENWNKLCININNILANNINYADIDYYTLSVLESLIRTC